MTDVKKMAIEDMSVDQLMEVAKQKLKKPIKPKKRKEKIIKIDQLKEFVVSEGIKSHHTVRVLSLVVYERYVKWAEATAQEEVMNFINFNREFSKLFKDVMYSKERYFMLHPEGFNISESHYETVREAHKKKKNKKKA